MHFSCVHINIFVEAITPPRAIFLAPSQKAPFETRHNPPATFNEGGCHCNG